MTTILSFLFLICILVAVHEYGHFIVARACGVRVLRFSIGFGKVLWKRIDKKGTEWVISLIPLGGYVKMLNNELGYANHERYESKKIWQKMLIILGGPFANFIFAIFAYSIVFMTGIPTLKPVVGDIIPNSFAATAQIPKEFQFTEIDKKNVYNWEDVALGFIGHIGASQVEVGGHLIDSQYHQTFQLDLSKWQFNGNEEDPIKSVGIQPKTPKIESTIKQVIKDSPASKAGVKKGDKILKVNKESFNWFSFIDVIQKGQVLTLEIERDNQLFIIDILPEKQENSSRYTIGIVPKYQPLSSKYQTEIKFGFLGSVVKASEKAISLTHTIVRFIGNLITGNLSINNMGGPISMAKGAVVSAEIGFIYYLSFMALISVNLGVMNLFPILPLDGGQFILLSAELISGKKISAKIQQCFQQLGMFFVIGLMFFTLFNDLLHI